MGKIDKEKIKKITTAFKCPKDFCCYRPKLESPKEKESEPELRESIECFRKDSGPCNFAVSYGLGRFCRCPLRRYIAEKAVD